MRVGALIVALAALLLVALWFGADREREAPRAQPPLEAVTPPTPAPVQLPDEPEPEPEPVPQDTAVAKCRPSFKGEGPPLELTLSGPALPEVPPKSLSLEVRWTEDGQPQRWFVSLNRWKATVWLCDESEVTVTRGPYRLRSQRVPRSGAVSLFLEQAAAPSDVTLRTVSHGAPAAGVRVSLTGCAPVVTTDVGVAVTSCEQVDEPRRVAVRAPWRSATLLTVSPNATEATISVLGRDEIEPGRVGLGFAPRATTPVVGLIMEGGPAQRAGVKVGDEVLEVGGVGVATVEEAMPRIIGVPGSTVRFKLRRGRDVVLVDVERVP